MRGQDLLTALADELRGTASELSSAYDLGSDSEPGAGAHANDSYITSVTRLSEAAGYMGLDGIKRICASVLDNLDHLDANDADARVLVRPFFTEWAGLLEAHLRDASATAPIDSLLTHFGGGWVPLPLEDDDLTALRAELSAANSIGAALDEDVAPETLTEADFTLEIGNDVDAALLDAFMNDSPPQATEVTQSLSGWLSSSDKATPDKSAPDRAELLRSAKRAAHTLKGSANILGIRGLAKLAHRLEDLLEICEADAVAPSEQRARALVAAADCLEQMVAAVAGEDEAPENALAVIAMIDAARDNNFAGQIFMDDIAALEAPTPESAAEFDDPVTAGAPVTPRAATRGSQMTREMRAMTRVPTQLLDELVRMVGEITIKVGELEQELKATSVNSRQLVDQDRSIQKRLFELENSVDIRGVAARHKLHAVSAAPASQGLGAFDSLELDQYNEVQSITRSLIEETTDARDLGLGLKDELAGLAGIVHQQQRLMRELAHLTSQTRMAPVETIVPRLQRNVRQTATATRKLAQLVVVGQDILVDADVLNQLLDPLLHILRNAVDHGLEYPEERVARGKPPTGTITLNVARRGQVVTVQVSDDGRGLDLRDIRSRAVERGLLAPDAMPTDPEIARLTLLPGFSTRDMVTEISGRGVGLDVVATRLRALAGSIDIRSRHGEGLTIELRFQASLVATHALFVRDGGQVFGIASHAVRRAVPAVAVQLHREGGELFAHVDDERYPAHELASLTSLAPASAPERRNLVIVDTETGPIGLLVDAVLDASELVTRPTGRYLKRIPGVAGIGLLGNGSVIPLLDVAELARSPHEQHLRAAAEARSHAQAQRRARVLVVDDSLSVRRAIASLLEDHGYDVVLARDGLEAIKSMDVARPDVLLTDLEMPNMNGLELAAHVRSRPEFGGLTIIMITSRSMDKHRRQALSAGVNVYLNKPYSDHELLQHVAEAVTARVERRVAAG